MIIVKLGELMQLTFMNSKTSMNINESGLRYFRSFIEAVTVLHSYF